MPYARRAFANFEQPERNDDVWEFEPTPRISTHIAALILGPYHSVHGAYEKDGQSVPLGIYCRPSLADYLDTLECVGRPRVKTPRPIRRPDGALVPNGRDSWFHVPDWVPIPGSIVRMMETRAATAGTCTGRQFALREQGLTQDLTGADRTR